MTGSPTTNRKPRQTRARTRQAKIAVGAAFVGCRSGLIAGRPIADGGPSATEPTSELKVEAGVVSGTTRFGVAAPAFTLSRAGRSGGSFSGVSCRGLSDLLDHSADPRTDLGINATGPGLTRHQMPPVLHRMWLGAVDPLHRTEPKGRKAVVNRLSSAASRQARPTTALTPRSVGRVGDS